MKKLLIFILIIIFLFSFAGCADVASQGEQTGSEAPSEGSSSPDGDETPEEEQFTSRDMEVGYSESVTVTLSDSGSSADGQGVTVDGSTVIISAEGSYLLTGSLSDGQIQVAAPEDAKLQLVLSGVSVTCTGSAALYVKTADKVFVTTANGSENSLTSLGEYTAIDENNIDAAVFSKSDLTLNGQGSLTVRAQTGHGIVSKDDLVITGGTLGVTSPDHALAGQDSVRIAEGSLSLVTQEDGIHGGSSDTAGYVWIQGGQISIDAGDDGIHAEAALTIKGGDIEITRSYEGLEGADILISGGSVSITASDDGINAASGTGGGMMMGSDGSALTISGGLVNIDAGGDGLDSNGDLYISGGETYVSGPTDSANGAVDYGGSASVSGGVIIAAGASGMAEGFGESSTQGAMLIVFDSQHSAGDEISLTDSSGAVLCRYTPTKSYGCALISAPGITDSGSYTVSAGSESRQVEMTAITYSEGGMGGGFGHGGMGGGQKPQGGVMPSDIPQQGQRPDRPGDAVTSATTTA